METRSIKPLGYQPTLERTTPSLEKLASPVRRRLPFLGPSAAPRNLHLVKQTVVFCFDSAVAFLVLSSILGNAGAPTTEVIALVAFLQVGLLVGAFYEARTWSRWQVLYEGVKAAAVTGMLAASYVAITATSHSLIPLVSGLGFVWSVVIGWRLIFFKTFSVLPRKRMIIIGATEPSAYLENQVRQNGSTWFEVVGIVDDNHPNALSHLPTLGRTEDLLKVVESFKADWVVLGDLNTQASHINGALIKCVERGIEVLTIPAVCERVTRHVPVRYVDESWLVSTSPRTDKPYLYGKRLLDVVLSCVGMALTLLILPLIALVIKIFDPGPILYSQIRVGYQGRDFKIYKFRTMRINAEENGAVWAKLNDDRVTAVGKFLRQTRLDELPQFWNVLKGEMSLIGPRPERPEFVSQLEREIPHYSRRHAVLPGLTGWAQVMFSYGASVEDSLIKLQYDLFYIRNRSFYLDAKILIKTVFVMVNKIGSR